MQGLFTQRNMILISSLIMPFEAYVNSTYFAMRSGGKVGITFIFDSGFMWIVVMPVSFILTYLTKLPILPLFLLCQLTDVFKAVFGFTLYKKRTWANTLVNDKNLNE